jgi:predicted dehydrogenase
MSDRAVGNFRLLITPGEPERSIVLGGVEGTLTLTSQWVTVSRDQDSQRRMRLCNELQVVRQRPQDKDPVVLQVADSDRQPAGVLSGQHTWNRLIADFVSAVRDEDRWHHSVPHLPHISDGLAAQRLIQACELSHAEGRWIELSPPGP